MARRRQSIKEATISGPAAVADQLRFPKPVNIRASGCRPVVRTAAEALLMIDNELPVELRGRSRWTFARALFDEAMRTGRGRDLDTAIRQLKQALSNEGWLREEQPAQD